MSSTGIKKYPHTLVWVINNLKILKINFPSVFDARTPLFGIIFAVASGGISLFVSAASDFSKKEIGVS